MRSHRPRDADSCETGCIRSTFSSVEEVATSVISWEGSVSSFLDGAPGLVDVHVRVRGKESSL